MMNQIPEGLSDKTMRKIVEKVYSIAITKLAVGAEPRVTTPELKHILSTHHVTKKQWFKVVKYLESGGLGRLHGHHYFVVILSSQSLAAIYKMRSAQLQLRYRTSHRKP